MDQYGRAILLKAVILFQLNHFLHIKNQAPLARHSSAYKYNQQQNLRQYYANLMESLQRYDLNPRLQALLYYEHNQ